MSSSIKTYELLEPSKEEIQEHIVSCLNKNGLANETRHWIRDALPDIIQKYGLAGKQISQK